MYTKHSKYIDISTQTAIQM